MTIILKNRIMLGVYALYVIRKLKNPYVMPALFLGLFFLPLTFLVSIPSVVSNLILTRGAYSFVSDAFSKTDIIVQALALLSSVSGLFYVSKISRQTVGFIRGKFV